MKRKICSLLLLSFFICSLLTACGSSSPAVSGPSNSYSTGTSGTSQKNEISTSMDWIHPEKKQTSDSGYGGYGSNGWGYGSTTYYLLYADVTIKNTGDVPAHIDDSLFTAYWDDDELSYYTSCVKPIDLAPGEQTTVELKYEMDRAQYNSWYSNGHIATIIIQYGNDALAYVYSTDTREVTVVY